MLGNGGFGFKYVVCSGKAPREKESPGINVKLLGFKWNSEKDVLYPEFEELDFKKKVRGAKKPNIQPVITIQDAGRLMTSIILTRRMVVSILAELYGPDG